ncbi:MAG: diguanylate cyclase [Lachnospiraceae bacterium]|nr:diguanylate cyclase [Lachnospiraceae bacterium]
MYDSEFLARYPFFSDIIRYSGLSTVLDPLTGVVSRPYMIEFVRRMIRDNVPFTFALLDLDNFKFINDTYGHETGDEVLKHVGDDLIHYIGDRGVIGRYGGDEFLIVNFKDLVYADKKKFFEGMYANYHVKNNVLRKNLQLGICEPYISGTTGCASFPEDAQDYSGLFALIDKTMYRGKCKGRNCYIIYVEEKHKSIEIGKLEGRGLSTTLHNLSEQFDLIDDLEEKLQLAFTTLRDDLRVTDLYYVGRSGILKSVSNSELAEPVPGIDNLMTCDIYSSNNIADIEAASSSLYRILKELDMLSVLIVRIRMQKETYGYLMCAEKDNMRYWQENDCAVLYYMAREIAWFIRSTGAELE